MEKRLQSIKLPRDLTLGGTKPRKTFAPNLNVARNKERNKEFLLKVEDKRKRHSNDFRKNKFERSDRFVQSSGIFSDGIGNDLIKKMRQEKVFNHKDETNYALPIPKVKKDEWQVDNKNETKIYDDIMGSNDIGDNDEKLPFAPVSWNEADFKNNNVNHIDDSLTPKEFQETENFSDYNPALTLWSMPDSFAGKGLSDDPTVRTLFDYKLTEMVEGRVGTMLIRKSGKMEVLIGCVKYSMNPASLESFTEKIVEIDFKQANQPTGVTVGQLQNRFILNPDWAYLLRDS